MYSTPLDMPTYAARLKVRASLITAINRHVPDVTENTATGSAHDKFHDEFVTESLTLSVPTNWHPEAAPGGYLVQFHHGLLSVYPTQRFEEDFYRDAPVDPEVGA